MKYQICKEQGNGLQARSMKAIGLMQGTGFRAKAEGFGRKNRRSWMEAAAYVLVLGY